MSDLQWRKRDTSESLSEQHEIRKRATRFQSLQNVQGVPDVTSWNRMVRTNGILPQHLGILRPDIRNPHRRENQETREN